jgi:hypothetical protein
MGLARFQVFPSVLSASCYRRLSVLVFPDITREICVFLRIPRKISWEVGKTGKSITIFLQELKSKARAGKADTRSRRLRSTFPGTGPAAERRATVTIYESVLLVTVVFVALSAANGESFLRFPVFQYFLKLGHLWKAKYYEIVRDMLNSLKPLLLTVETLSNHDANFVISEGIFKLIFY